MLKVLIPKAKDPNMAVASNVLTCLGELARVGGEDLSGFVKEMMTLVIDTLEDPSSLVKRDAALRTLGQICSNTGYVIQPLIDYPQLHDIIAKILKNDQNIFVKREAIKVLGILGALDPHKKNVGVFFSLYEYSLINFAQSKENPVSEPVRKNDLTAALHTTGTSSEEYYQTVVINALLSKLKDQSATSAHHTVIEAIMAIFKTQGLKCISFLPRVCQAHRTFMLGD